METELQSPLVAKLEWRHDISPNVKQQLVRLLGRERMLEAGQDFKQDILRAGAVGLLLDGLAARYKLMSNGRRQITALHVPGDFVDLPNLLIGPSDYEVTALAPSRLAFAEHDLLHELMAGSTGITRILWTDSLVEAAIQQEWLVSMGRRSALQHLAHVVCELFLRFKVIGQTEGLSFRLPLTQSDVADVLGLSMVHVNRMLKTLRSDGVMTWANHHVTIVNWKRLREIAEFDAGYLAFRDDTLLKFDGLSGTG